MNERSSLNHSLLLNSRKNFFTEYMRIKNFSLVSQIKHQILREGRKNICQKSVRHNEENVVTEALSVLSQSEEFIL